MSWRGTFKTWRKWAAATAGFAAIGCGTNQNAEAPPGVVDRVALTGFTGSSACEDLETYLEDNAVKMMRTQIEGERDSVPQWGWWGGGPVFFGGPGREDAAAAPAGGQDKSAAPPANYTTTNTQVAGVDEADFVKNDGTRI